MSLQVFLREAGETLHSVGVLDYNTQQGQELRNLDRGITEEVLTPPPSPPIPPPPQTCSPASLQDATLSKYAHLFWDQGCSKQHAVIVRWTL